MPSRGDAPRLRLNIAAVAVGLGVDIVGSLVAGIALISVFGVDLMDAAAVDRLTRSMAWLAAALPVGLLFTAIGGYVAALLARGAELNHAFAVGLASAITSVLASLPSPSVEIWYLVLFAMLTVPAALAGGYIRARMAA
jgi:hypothetical protein